MDRVLLLRPYEASDSAVTLETFVDAILTTASADYTPGQVQAWARPGERDTASWHAAMANRNSFVASRDGDVVGFSDVTADGYIDMMFVSPQHQRQGVASALLAEAERRARIHGATELSANVSITARPFFERQGFHVEHEQRPVAGGVEMVNFRMRKPL